MIESEKILLESRELSKFGLDYRGTCVATHADTVNSSAPLPATSM